MDSRVDKHDIGGDGHFSVHQGEHVRKRFLDVRVVHQVMRGVQVLEHVWDGDAGEGQH